MARKVESAEQIWNMALRHLGVSMEIPNITDDTPAARAMAAFYATARDEVLRDFYWPFATKYASLTLVSDPDEQATLDFRYAYEYPSDCIKARRVLYGFPARFEHQQNRVSFWVGQSYPDRLLIYTDVAPVDATDTSPAWPQLDYIAALTSSVQATHTQLDICNRALRHLGLERVMDSLDDDSEEAAACNRWYEQARDEVLRTYPWPFARKYLNLELVAGPSPPASPDFLYSYRYPIDCVTARRIVNPGEGRIETQQGRVAFRIGQDANGLLIYTDVGPDSTTVTEVIPDPVPPPEPPPPPPPPPIELLPNWPLGPFFFDQFYYGWF